MMHVAFKQSYIDLRFSYLSSLNDVCSCFAVEVEEQPVVTSTNTEIISEFLKAQTTKAPCDFPKTKALRAVAPFCPSSQRSPLGTRNVHSGSLRSIVQLKEARKVESMRNSKSPADSLRLRNNGSFIDKENL